MQETTDDGKSDVENEEHFCTDGRIETGAAILENSVEVPRKIKNRITLRPSNSTTRNLSKGYRSADS